MDSLSAQKPKSRKIKKIAKKTRVQILYDLFSRAIEIVVVMVTLAKLCYELVITLEDSGVASVILANRNLAFLVGNAIVVALIAKSGLFSNREVDLKCRSKSNDLYDEFVRESARGKQSEAEKEAKQSIAENRAKENEVVVKQSITENEAKQNISVKTEKQRFLGETEKQSISEKKMTKQSVTEKKMTKQSKIEKKTKVTKQSVSEKREKQIQSYQRSLSENLEGSEKISCGKLKRSETDASSERFDSDDELRYKIESFIARQRRNQKDD